MSKSYDRRNVLKGMMAGSAVTVGIPFLDCFLNENGTAFANGNSLPVCFGTWFQGLGFNPTFWEPKGTGTNWENGLQFKPLDAIKSKINVFSGMKAQLDSSPLQPHVTGQMVSLSGGISKQNEAFPSIDTIIADVIGTKTRFRSLEVSCDGTPLSYSRRSGSSTNPSEMSPAALYTRIFGPEFKDPNAANFTPDPVIMARRSALSAVTEQRKNFVRDLGASDQARLDEYFTALRELENQLDLQLQKPAPLEACTTPEQVHEATLGPVVEDARTNHKLFSILLAHAFACGQTRVFNLNLAGSSNLRKPGSAMTYHMYTHEESVDEKLGYQPTVAWFEDQVIKTFVDMVQTLDSIKEGSGTLLDRCLVLYATDHGFAKFHSIENIPMLTAGNAGGRLKSGMAISAPGDTITRVGLTVQQVMGVSVSAWGTESNQTRKPFTEVIAA